jgi:hypothetical protein
MPKLLFQCASLVLIATAAGGCTTTISATTTICSVDAAVSCPQGGAGWSCDGGGTRPDMSETALACSSAVVINGKSEYCCASVSFPTGGACQRDSGVAGCTYGSYGFSCSGTSRPDDQDTTLTCSIGVSSGGRLEYCCLVGLTMTTGCSQDPSVSCQQAGSYGFSCTGSGSPADSDPGLTCSTPTTDANGNSLYCCENQVTTTTGSCSASSGVSGCVGGSSGYACTGTATPDPALNCSQGVPGTSGTYYCCGGTAGSCAADGTVTGCTGAALGYSCTGSVRPDVDGSTQCSTGVPLSNGSTGYCCIPVTSSTTSTCSTDPSVTGCTGGSYGFSCTGTDRPSDTNTHLTCGDGAAGNNGNTLYCCQST